MHSALFTCLVSGSEKAGGFLLRSYRRRYTHEMQRCGCRRYTYTSEFFHTYMYIYIERVKGKEREGENKRERERQRRTEASMAWLSVVFLSLLAGSR